MIQKFFYSQITQMERIFFFNFGQFWTNKTFFNNIGVSVSSWLSPAYPVLILC